MITTRIAIMFVALSTSVLAQAPGQDRFQRLDANGDGKISPEELRAPRLFLAIDTDHDGMVTRAELRAARQRPKEQPHGLEVPADAPFQETAHTIIVDERERSYVVQAPKKPNGPLPVVFFFHGGGGRGENMAAVGFQDMVAREHFLAVYPSGWKNNWNDGRNAARIASQREEVDDVKFVRTIVDDLEKRHSIDRGRIFATGASNGGIFCHYLAAHAANLFAAVAPVIGGLAEPVAPGFKPSHPISLLVIQGDADPLVPIGGGAIANSDRGGRVIATEEMLKKYLAHNGIAGEAKVEKLPDLDPKDGTTTEVRRWPPGRDGVRVEYYLVKGGGHTMPGRGGVRARGRQIGVGRVSGDFDGLKVIWDFFKACPPRRQQTGVSAPKNSETPQATTARRTPFGTTERTAPTSSASPALAGENGAQ